LERKHTKIGVIKASQKVLFSAFQTTTRSLRKKRTKGSFTGSCLVQVRLFGNKQKRRGMVDLLGEIFERGAPKRTGGKKFSVTEVLRRTRDTTGSGQMPTQGKRENKSEVTWS